MELSFNWIILLNEFQDYTNIHGAFLKNNVKIDNITIKFSNYNNKNFKSI
jgi:hypothetical protein